MMKKTAKMITALLCLSAVCSAAMLSGCEKKVEYIPDPEPYQFTNPAPPQAETDADMTIDGVLDEARWSESRWLYAVDVMNAQQYADIEFTTSYGEKGVYFAIKVEETGTNIYVNPNRTSYYNSCIEMYMGPATDGGDSPRCFEFDFLADGSYESKLNYNGWNGAKTTYEKMPVVAATTLGGEVNTLECYGYIIEAFFPWGFLEFADYDVETQEQRDALVLGPDPVHIFSLRYDGTDLNGDRFWSDWAADYIPVGFQNPSTFFKFGKDGLIAYDYTVTYTGSGSGTLEEEHGWDYFLAEGTPTFVIRTLNGAEVTSFKVNGVDCTGQLSFSGGVYTYEAKNAREDLAFEVEIG